MKYLKNMILRGKTVGFGLLLLGLTLVLGQSAPVTAVSATTFPHQTGTRYTPYLEWSVTNTTYSGNPYDLVATVTFTHNGSNETRTTEMFYAGSNTWQFRFSGTQTGNWSFVTSSTDSDLNGHNGSLTINDQPDEPGFVTHYGNKWGRVGTQEAFVPQFVMVSAPHNYYNNTSRVDAEIQTFIVQHGFNGFHTPVFCRWFEIDQPKCGQLTNYDPDPKTFSALELLITKVYEAGGIVHIWMWGDDNQQQNPNFLPGGINGTVDRRLQRYIAARLGPLPGWTMGYGFDLVEWVNGNQLTTWHDNMQGYFGWPHYLGARSQKNQLTQLSEAMDYSSYEQFRPTYDKYVQTIDMRPTKPSFSEDRFRIRTVDGTPTKDYNMEMTRRGLWDSTMAGGVANIWGNLTGDTSANDGSDTSFPYSNPEWIKTYATFFADRFILDMDRCNSLTNGVCLQRPNNKDYIFYGEDVTSLQLNLTGMSGGQTAVAVDAAKVYSQINLGTLSPSNQTWRAPYRSDWAIAIGDFSDPPCIPGGGLYTFSANMLRDMATLNHKIYLPFIGNNSCP